jgi:glutamyl-tRNA synthetase
MLNDYFARSYEGKMILRFDDTNPSKEKEEFEQSIKEDLATLEIKADVVTHTSDSFDLIFSEAIKLIKMGKAYVDDTDQETVF